VGTMPRKILLVYAKGSAELLNRQSALGSYVFCLCELLESAGMKIWVNGEAFEKLKSSAISPNNKNTLPVTSGFKKYIPLFIKNVLKDLLVFKNIKQVVKQINIAEHYDCVLEFYTYGSNVGLTIANELKRNLIVVYDSPVMEEYAFFQGPNYLFENKIVKREEKTLRHASHIVCYSNPVKEYLKKRISEKLPVFIHQNVDFTRFDFIEHKPEKQIIHIGFIGSFLKWHNVELLLKTFTQLKQKEYPVQLYLLGMGAEFNRIQELVNSNKFKKDIIIPGFVDGSALLDFKKLIHIGVMPGSNWYGAPNKIFEYGAANMAVIAPDTPTIKDLFVDKEEVYLFENNSEIALYNALKQLCDDPGLIARLAENLHQKIRTNYSKTNTFDFYNWLITEAIK
jgi:glycosyltransferase involved in cell wall biosynthesis